MEEKQVTKKPRLADAPSPHAPAQRLPLSSLPHVVVEAIFRFVVEMPDPFTQLNTRGDFPMRWSFRPIALVSKEWLTIARQLHSEYELRHAVATESLKRSFRILQRQELTRRRAFVTRLVLKADGYGPKGSSMRFAMETLSYLPHIRELDLERLSCSSGELTTIVQLAGRVCPAMRKLVLPSRAYRNADYAQLVAAVFDAASEWRNHKSGGLRYLRLPVDEQLKDSESSNAYVNQIVSCCPRVERIDDGRYPKEEKPSGAVAMESGEGAALWQVDLDTWTRFCETCSQLTSFNWLGMPFATQFFEIFGQHMKPNLKTLTLGTSDKWKWASYLSQANAATVDALTTKGYASTAANLQAVLSACPRLRSLSIMAHSAVGNDMTQLLDAAAVYNEGFWETLARSCPMLEILNVRQRDDASISVAITDTAMRGLATLAGLHSVSLDFVTMSGDALFELVVNHAADSRRGRSYTIRHGHDAREKAYYTILEGFVRRLTQYDGELPCASRRVVLELESVGVEVDEKWSVEYFARLQDLVELAREKHPEILLSGVVNDYDCEQQSFSSIHRFSFTTQPTAEDRRETDRDMYEGIDEVFVSQRWASQSGSDDEGMMGYYDEYGESSDYDYDYDLGWF